MNRRLGLGLALAVVAAGCSSDPHRGYSTEPTHDARHATVSVPMFGNDTFQRGVEFQLTDAVVKEIQRTTPWRVASAEDAQTTLTAVVTDTSLRKLTTTRQGLAQELAYELTVRFEWKDNRTGEVLVSRSNFHVAETFVPALGVGERLEVGQHEAVQAMARAIVDELRSNW